MAKIVVGVAGSIAAYRSPDFVKELVARGHEVRVVLTAGGQEFVSPRVLETFSGTPVLSRDPFDPTHFGTDHIAVSRWADLFVVYGATASFMARYATGLADDFLCLQLIATRAPVILAPAMNPAMWEHPSVQDNLRTLEKRGVLFSGPDHGKVACGEVGQGHVADLRAIADDAERALKTGAQLKKISTATPSWLKGKTLLISAGPMRSGLDSVRFIQNRSSGKMGLELARAARELGAKVQVLLGPVDPAIAEHFHDFEVHPYEGAGDYQNGLDRLLPGADAFLSAAAVLDFDVLPEKGKIDRSQLQSGTELKVQYRNVPDFVARAAASRKPKSGQKIIAFAAEAGTDTEMLQRASDKLKKKGTDAIVANPVRPGLGPEAENNELWVLRAGQKDPIHLGPAPKAALAEPLLRVLFDESVKSA